VRSPANAHKVLGIGAYDVTSGLRRVTSGRGPTRDGRIKPDLLAPTNTETASTSSPTATTVFGGTSGATPYAAAAAGLVRAWQEDAVGGTDPGQVYAAMILSGRRDGPVDDVDGAGRLSLPTGGELWWGSTTVEDGETVAVPLDLPEDTAVLEAALWWPEEPGAHGDVDLVLADETGTARAASTATGSVFERARTDAGPGRWTARLQGADVPGSRTVYWTVWAHPGE